MKQMSNLGSIVCELSEPFEKLKIQWKKKGEKRTWFYLPKAEEYNPLDAQELCKWLMRCQLFRKNMVKDYQRI